MASAPAPRWSARARRPLPQPADGAMASTSTPRRSARARRPPARLADSAMAPTSARRRTATARRPLQQPSDRAAASSSAQPVLPDEIWEEIFVRLDAAADLARASAACSSFRRIVSEPRFLRRFGSLRSSPILGFITSSIDEPFITVGPTHRSAPESRALQQAADFTFDFVPHPTSWRFIHARDGRVLLSSYTYFKIRPDFIVCDPLHRRYVMIPGMPDGLLAAFTPFGRPVLPFLAPVGENDDDDSFRIICPVLFKDKVMALVFSSCNQTWQGISTTICLPNIGCTEYGTYYAHGCFYWTFHGMSCSLMLDTSAMEFSIIGLPPHNFDSPRAIVEAAEGRLGFLTIGDGTIELYCKKWQSNRVGTQEWLHDKLIPLPKDFGINYCWEILGTAGRYLALVARQKISDKSPPISEHFVLDIKTLLVENLRTSKNGAFFGFPYARFPPPLALPSI